MDQIGESVVVYGSSDGITFLERYEEIRHDIKILAAKTQVIRRNKEFRASRHTSKSPIGKDLGRYDEDSLEIYIRDVLMSGESTNVIKKGYSVMHEGDAISDAVVFEHDHRPDRYFFQGLYGLDVDQVLDVGKFTFLLIEY